MFKGGTHLVTGFRDFILRGNIVDLAIAIVVGTAFTALVKSFVADIITPLIAAIYGGEAFTDLYFTVHNSRFLIGDFINNVLSFLIICLVVYLFVVLPVTALLNKYYPKQPKVKCPHCLEDINEGATRCKWCTSEVTEESVLPTINMGKEVPAKPVPEKAAPAKNPDPADAV